MMVPPKFAMVRPALFNGALVPARRICSAASFPSHNEFVIAPGCE